LLITANSLTGVTELNYTCAQFTSHIWNH